MMPGETHSKMAGIASEAAGSCQNCTSLQQSLNEYVAALIALKQKIIDSDQLLAEYQQKCDDLQYAERENETLRCQLEQTLQKISPQEQHLEELTSLKAQLEEKTSTLKIYQQTQLEYVRVKEECEKSDIAKKKLEAKLKKMEEAAAKHDKDYKQLRLEKKVIGKELKKIQKKLDFFQNEKSKKVAMKNAQTQVARKEPVVKLDKQKIKYLLEEIWGCVESSTGNGDCNLLMFGNVEKYELTIPDIKVGESKRQKRKIKSSPECKLSSHNNLEVNQTQNPLTELDTVQASILLTKQCNSPHNEPAVVEFMDVSDFGGDAALKIVVSKDLSDCSSGNSDLESEIDELWEAQDWAKPLPNLLSPIHCSPLTVKNVFGEITDSSEDESISERDLSNCVSQPKIESILANGTDKNCHVNHEAEHVLEATCNFDDPDLTTELKTNMQTTDILQLQEAQTVTKDPIQMECEKRIPPLTNSTTCSEEFLTDSLNGPVSKSQSPEFCENSLTVNENVAIYLDADSVIPDSACSTENDKLRLDNTTTSCSQLRNVKQSEIVDKIEDLIGNNNNEPLGNIVANKSPTAEIPLAPNDLKSDKDILISVDRPNVRTLSCDQETLLNMLSDNCLKNEESNSLNDIHGEKNMSNDSIAHSKDTIWQQSLQNSVDDLSKVSEENLDKTLNPMSSLMSNCIEETDQPGITSNEKSVLRHLEQSQQSEPLRQTPPLLSSNNLSTVFDCGVHINKTLETHTEKVANVMNEHNTFTSMESQCKIVDKEYDLEKCSLQDEMLNQEPEQQNCSDFGIDKEASTFIFHNKADLYERTISEPVDHSSPSSPVKEKAETELQSSHDSQVSQSSTVYLNDKCMPCIDSNTDVPCPDLDESVHQDLNRTSVISSSPVDLAVDREHKNVQNRVETQRQEEAQSIGFSIDLSSSISEEKNTIICPLSKADLTDVKATLSSKVFPVVSEELQIVHLPSESSDSFKIVKKDACDVSLDSSESDYEFPIRKVNFSRPTLNNQVVKNESFRNSSDATKSGGDALSIVKEKEDLQEHTNHNGKHVATVIKPSPHEGESDKLIEPRNSALHTFDTVSETSERNGAGGCSDGKSLRSKDHSLEESTRQNISDLVNSGNDAEKNVKNNAETEGQKILPGKNLIWNFSRPDDFVDPRTACLTRKQKINSENVCVNLENSVSKNFQTLKKENLPHRLPHGGTVPVNAPVGQTVLATADTSTSTGLSPETINKVRSEMGPPLPPLLGPLLPTPPRSMRSLSPIMSSSSRSSLPSPLDELISPLPGTPFPPLMSPLCDGRKRKSPVFNTPSPAEKANQRILSSPLQFCAATPKHAVPVPGRLPLSANGSSACNVQENSVKILDTMYPELSARARTLNILKGNVHLNRGMSGDSQNVPVTQITGFKSITSTSTVFIKTGSNSKTSNKEKPNTCETQMASEGHISVNKRSIDSFQMPKSAKRLRLDSESPVAESVKDCFAVPEKSLDTQKVDESSQNLSYCEPLPDIVKGNSVDEDIIANALKKVEELCFDLLPVIRSHIHVGTIPNVPVMRNEEKEVIYDFSSSKKGLADRFLHILLKKIKSGKRSLASSYLQALCRVYVGLCRQLGDIERARVLCYSILKEDFPDPDKLLLFIISSWNDILSLHGVLSKAIQAVLKSLAVDDVGSCLSAYLNWEKSPPMNVSVLLNSVLMAIQLYPDVQFHQSEKYGEDLTDNVWEYVFAVDLLCSHRKWTWTHEHVISKELWPILDKWVRRKKGNLTFQFVPDIIVATVLRLVGHLCQMGLKEGFITAVKNVTSVIITFLSHANEEGVPWGVQLASVYMLCDTAPCDPVLIHQTLLAWKETAKNNLPPAVINLMQETASLCVTNK